MTILRDIVKLEASGKVISVSRDVQLTKALHSKLPHGIKVEQQASEKAQIGQLTAQLLPEYSTIYLDDRTTSLETVHKPDIHSLNVTTPKPSFYLLDKNNSYN